MTAAPAAMLPADGNAERLILGSAMFYGGNMDLLRGSIDVEDFSTESHQRIWRACCAGYDANGRLESAIVCDQLQKSRQLESIGGLTYLADLYTGLPDLPSLDWHVGQLKEKARLRKLIQIADYAMKRCFAADSSTDIQDALLRDAQELAVLDDDRKAVSTRDLTDKYGIDGILNPQSDQSGLRLPWGRLQSALNGMRAGQMIVVAASTSRGKTSLACQIATHCTRQSAGVMYWTTEMSPVALYRRMIDQMSGTDATRHRGSLLSSQELERGRAAVGWLYERPVWFDRVSRTVPAFLACLRQAQQRNKIELAVVDHLQHVRGIGRQDSRAREVSEISRSLKMAAIDLEIPFLVLSQVSRPKEDGAPLTIHAIKESGDVENDADVVILINSPKPNGHPVTEVPVGLNVAKQREGPAGFDIPLIFHPGTQAFESVED